jgi:hypothetical protein
MEHLIKIAAERRDTAVNRRLDSLRVAASLNSERPPSAEWLVAFTTGDTTALHSLIERIDRPWDVTIALFHEYTNIDVEWSRRVRDAVSEPTTDAVLGTYLFEQYIAALRRGEHGRAMGYALRRPETSAPYVVLAGTYSELGPKATREAVARTTQLLNAGMPHNGGRGVYYRSMCALTQWRLWQKDTTAARFAIHTLASAPDRPEDGPNPIADAVRCAEVLEHILAYATGEPDIAGHAAALDSINRLWRDTRFHGPYIRFAAARLFELAGRPDEALRALRRHTYAYVEWHQEARHRESGRLALMIGDTAFAIQEFEYYLAFRSTEDDGGRFASQPVREMLRRIRAKTER